MNCVGCGSLNTKQIFRLPNIPRFTQKVLDRPDADPFQGQDVQLLQCGECGLVQVDPDSLSHDGYWEDYLNSRAVTQLYAAYDELHAEKLSSKFSLAGKTVLEVGCGDGYFLERLRERKVHVCAIEPSHKAAEILKQKQIPVYNTYVDDQIVETVKERFDGLICRQVLDLVKSPNMVLRNAARLLRPGACALIDVPSWSKLLIDQRYYSVLPDRVSYFTAETLLRFLERNGFHVLEIFHGAEDEYVGAYCLYQPPGHELLTEFCAHFDNFCQAYEKLLQELKNTGKSIAAWGAGAKGVTIFSMMKTGPKEIRYVIDKDPTRWERYMPGSQLKIVKPEMLKSQPVDVMIVTASMFLKEIVAELIDDYQFTGQIVALSPTPHVLSDDDIQRLRSAVSHA
jgi:2-polyprenyl-3-methyl-5-hydroxy-6-metoxy-1,4-benzoquinol methylase